MDQIFKYFVASTFTAHVPLLCLLMYNLLDMQQTMGYRLYGLYWMVMIMVQSVTVAVAATMVNTQVGHVMVNTQVRSWSWSWCRV